LPNVVNWQALGVLPVIVGSAVGAYSHVVLDAMVHADVRPYAPFSAANPFLHVLPPGLFHWLRVAAAAAGLALLGLRHLLHAST
jgi:hypothetical protein